MIAPPPDGNPQEPIPKASILTATSRHDLSPEQAREGLLLLIDKPRGWTSFDVVNKIRGILRRRFGIKKFKVGHAGTLDPMATGLLLICTGTFTRRLAGLQGLDKTYTGTITLGGVTASYDADSPVEDPKPYSHLTDKDIRRVVTGMTGPILQLPPAFSAIKIDGQRSYKLARRGEDVRLEPRPIHIYQFDVEPVTEPQVRFSVRCSKGTYIRSLAHDLGRELGCGGYLSELRREAIGDFLLAEALDIDTFESWAHQATSPDATRMDPDGPDRE